MHTQLRPASISLSDGSKADGEDAECADVIYTASKPADDTIVLANGLDASDERSNPSDDRDRELVEKTSNGDMA